MDIITGEILSSIQPTNNMERYLAPKLLSKRKTRKRYTKTRAIVKLSAQCPLSP